MTDSRPETVLRDLATHLDVPPPPPDLATAVLARLAEPPADSTAPGDEIPVDEASPDGTSADQPANPTPGEPSADPAPDGDTRRDRPASHRRPTLLPRLAAAAIALLLALGVAMAVSPRVRATVLEVLRIGGVELTHEPPPPHPSTTVPLPGERTVTLDHARALADFPLRVPATLGDPTEVRVAGGTPPRVVTLHYAGVRIDQIDGRLDPVFQKFVHAHDARPTQVGDAHGVWLPRPHPVIYRDRHDRTRDEPARLAGTTLIWQRDGTTYRVEGDLTRTQAVEIAESLR